MGKMIKFLFQFFFACWVRKSQIRRSYFAGLPVDIITDIFVRLPIRSVLICRCVCKHWNTLISDPNFAKLLLTYTLPAVMIQRMHSRFFHLVEYDRIEWHERRNNPFFSGVFEVLKPNGSSSIKLDPKFEIPLLGTKGYTDVHVLVCNGLFYLGLSKDRDISLVCNPITGEFIRLPEHPPILKPCECEISWGFGFHSKTNQYKVMRMHIFKHDHRMVVEMLGVGISTTWINIEVDYPKNLISMSRFSTYLNGALHWIGRDVDGMSIWAFNFDTERFQSFSLPRDQGTKVRIFELRGFLCLMYFNEPATITMWMMERYGVGESWTPVLVSSDRNTNSSITTSHDYFAFHDRENKEYRTFRTHCNYDIQMFDLVPTLIPLKDIIIGDNVEVQNIYSPDTRKLGFC